MQEFYKNIKTRHNEYWLILVEIVIGFIYTYRGEIFMELKNSLSICDAALAGVKFPKIGIKSAHFQYFK